MSKTIDKLKALAAKKAGEEEDGDERRGGTAADGGEDPGDENPGDEEDGDERRDGTAADGENSAGDEDSGDEDPGDEGAPKRRRDGDAKALAALVAENADLKGRVSLLEKAFAAERAESDRLRAALADPSFRAAAMRPQDVPAGGEAGGARLSRKAAEAAYSKITDARERAKFREAHRAELGLN